MFCEYKLEECVHRLEDVTTVALLNTQYEDTVH